ncbi:MAG: GlsB/YeaQ/YmgE family stress response membrane protein [Rhodobacter sp.]|uniref:GlsB/YeaQ/YmgE family stress response membrane protein n=1 Tax=Pararhodobacter sp. TaxID=2127056 RepID=UPI001D76F012|nr:GlsB/YeaQ/YmgE family stress response membrane protein [Pararhodobacter sp.]MCB1344509.1 GlsB/YeaQ/YmgE family stress response membrane protein [Paracoccaceae bacterium]MCC0073530.1 GlsB/YeaQ/YmgE family stress response membrane protein [Rhodobacter sp.]HPD91821.1 GlsB/YeaQ/YmgE family stress response membrane protein [Pararhodobacter sp.]
MPGFVLLMVIGAAAGVLATRLMRMDLDLPTAMVVGVLGALAGGVVLRLIVTVGGWAITFALAVLGSMALLWIWQQIRR